MAVDTIRQALDRRGLLKKILLSTAIDELLAALTSAAAIPAGDDVSGDVTLAAKKNLGVLALDLTPPPLPVPFRLMCNMGAGSFRFWLVLNAAAPARKVFDFAMGAAGVVLKPASYVAANDEEKLVPAAGDVSISGVAVAILIEGRAGEAATLRLSPTVGQPAGIIELQLVPRTVLLGNSGFGIEFGTPASPGAFLIDDSSEAASLTRTMLNGEIVATRADVAAWRGLAVRRARFYLPSGVPLLGGHAVDAFVEIGMAPGEGIDLAIATRVPPKGTRPGIDVRIECRDPAATGLQDFIPTLVEAAMELPLDARQQDVPGAGGGFRTLAGKPVIVRLRFARSVSDPETRITLGIESQGPDGVLSVVAPDGGTTAKVLITAAALATALIADKAPAGADSGAVVLHTLLVAALGLSSALKDKGRLTIHKVELSSSGHGLPVGEKAKLLVDYSVDVLVRPIDVGVLSVQMRDEQPMRVRNRNVGLTLNLSNAAASGTDTLELDFRQADMEVEDPGGWTVNSPGSLFDILGTRSGRGSTWLEVDLRFKLNLGPVRVSGATIRATLNDNGTVSAELRGLDAGLDVPGVVKGGGRIAMLPDGGITAALDVNIMPLNLATDGVVLYQPTQGSYWLFVKIGVDLPGPIPIANTGLGIYGIAGSFGVNARPKPPAPTEPDPIGYQLRWDSSNPLTAFEFRADNMTIGAEAVLGTVPDLGFSFSSRGGLFITVPDVVVRGALWGTVMSPRMRVSDRPPEGGNPGLSFQGVVVVDAADGVTIGLKGQLKVPVLLEVVIPLGAHFPFGAKDADNWYVYLGSDGYRDAVPADGRGLGPMRATVLPDLLGMHADAYVMLRGRGIQKWPRGGAITIVDGLVIAFGFGFETVIGPKPLAWADVHASADILLATHPLTLAGFGTAGGSLNLGPFSIGVDAMLSVLAVENAEPYVHAQLCGHIDLFFTEIEGCVEMSINSEPALAVPRPDVHPLDDLVNGAISGERAFLIDDTYRRVGTLVLTPEELSDDRQVWPDTLLHLSFAISPKLAPGYVAKSGATTQFSSIDTYPTGLAAQPIGGDMLRYEWTLSGLALYDVTNDLHGAGTLVAGPMEAAWQAGKDGDIGTRPQAGDLVLLTYQGDLHLARLADGGAGLPNDPLRDASTLCQREVRAQDGWAVGHDAASSGAAFVLPADPLSADPCVSRFTARLTSYASPLPQVALGMHNAALLPPPYDFAAASLEVFAPSLVLERGFAGALELPVVGGPLAGPALFKRVQPTQSAMLVPQEPLTSARLWLIVDGRVTPDTPLTVAVFDNRGDTWTVAQQVVLPDGRTALRFVPATAGWVASVEFRWILGRRLAVLGLGGVTGTALRAAAARNAAMQAEAARQAKAAAQQPQKDTATTGEGVHAILEPGHTYRLDVAMTWEGWIYRQDDKGTRTEAGHDAGQTTYLPKGADPNSPPPTSRSYFFRTTPKPKPAVGVASALPRYGEMLYVEFARRRRNVFEPRMLERFLLGYAPAQTETARFRDDPLDVHFSAAHVTALATVYGFTLKLGLRRVDAPGVDGDAIELNPLWIALQDVAGLSVADRRRVDVAATALCAMPRPGGTLHALHPLAPLAWYEVYALAKSNDANILDGRLDGVTFRTSRWRTPVEMLAGIGFTAAPSAPSGDIELRGPAALAPSLIDGSDADFEAALDAIGLEGWPPVTAPRISMLWRPVGGAATPTWQCTGLLVESPEPIVRPGRVELSGLSTMMQPLPAGIFDIRRSDRSRSRMLWLCSVPFAPRAWMQRRPFQLPRRVFPTVSLALVDKASGAVLSGSVRLTLAPSFAEEA